MSLDVYLTDESGELVYLYQANITHNLNQMAQKAGIYEAVWMPDEIGITKAVQLIGPLREGLTAMVCDPAKFEAFDSPNGWGLYRSFVPWLIRYLAACIEHPDATVAVSR